MFGSTTQIKIFVLPDEKGITDLIVQGSRNPGSSVWVTDDGIALSYPTDINNLGNPDNTVLHVTLSILENSDGNFHFSALSPKNPYITLYACEIEN